MLAERELQRSLEQGVARHLVPGVSAAVYHAGKLAVAAAGIANISTGVQITPDTVMHVGSITKLFNATLLMQLVDEGAIDLDEKVRRHLPDLRLSDRVSLEKMTVRMLLNHTSGIDGDVPLDHGHDEETLEKAVSRFEALGQKHTPGTEFSYCNAGTVIAGYLAQRVTGRSWYSLLRERILAPLRLDHAAVLPEEALLYRASVGHYLSANSRSLRRTSVAFLPLSFGPAGASLMMSARDLVGFAKAHLARGVGIGGKRVLSEGSVERMQVPDVDNRGKGYTGTEGCGIGWLILENGLLHHIGGGPGIISVLYVQPQRDFAAAILTNGEHGLGLINELVQPWLNEVAEAQPFGTSRIRRLSQSVAIDTKRYVGVYEDSTKRFTVTEFEGRLRLSRQAKLAYYESISLEPTRPELLSPLDTDQFILGSNEECGDVVDTARIVAFRNPDTGGQMQHLGHFLYLYRRTH